MKVTRVATGPQATSNPDIFRIYCGVFASLIWDSRAIVSHFGWPNFHLFNVAIWNGSFLSHCRWGVYGMHSAESVGLLLSEPRAIPLKTKAEGRHDGRSGHPGPRLPASPRTRIHLPSIAASSARRRPAPIDRNRSPGSEDGWSKGRSRLHCCRGTRWPSLAQCAWPGRTGQAALQSM